MTADELIAKLQALPRRDRLVVVRGYESGYDAPDDVHEVSVYDRVGHHGWHEGRYGRHEYGDGEPTLDVIAIGPEPDVA